MRGDASGMDPARLDLVLAAADVGSFDWDMRSDRLDWDDRLCRIFGVDPETFGGDIATFYDLVHPDDLPGVVAAMQSAIDTCGDYRAEYRVRRPDGDVRWVDARGRVLCETDGTPQRMLGVAQDSTDHRRAGDTVARMLEHMADAFLAVDLGWRVTYINPPAADLLRVSRDTAPGRLLWEVWPGLATAGYDAVLLDAMERGKPATLSHYVVDTDRWFELRAVPGADGLSMFATDVTAAHAAELARSRGLTGPEQARRVLAYSQALAEAVSVADVTRVVATMVLPAFDASGLIVWLADSGKLRVAGHAGYPVDALEALDGLRIDGDAPVAHVLRNRAPVFIPSLEAYAAAYPKMAGVARATRKSAWAFLPLTASGRTLGCLTFSFDRPREVAPEERSLLVSLAGLLAQSLERARLRDAERHLAAELQQGLLPRDLDQAPFLRVAARYLPASDGLQVGGDWYDVVAHGTDRVTLVIGDVQGHNVHAASTMGQLRTGMRAYAAEGHDPLAVVSRSNRLMSEIDTDAFATCCVVEIDRRAGEMVLVRAGHPPALVRHADGTTSQVDGPVGLPLGVDPDEVYRPTSLRLRQGDVLALLTDGLVEDSRTPLEQGLGQVAAAMRDADPGDLDAFADLLVAPARTAAHRADDIALLVVRHDGGEPPPPSAALVVDRRDPRAARHAREFISGVLGEWHLDAARETTVLLVSEVVTNALRHTEGAIELAMTRLPGRLRVEVADETSVTPSQQEAALLDESGRGIPLLAGLSDRWGSAPRGEGKIVWFELDDHHDLDDVR